MRSTCGFAAGDGDEPARLFGCSGSERPPFDSLALEAKWLGRVRSRSAQDSSTSDSDSDLIPWLAAVSLTRAFKQGDSHRFDRRPARPKPQVTRVIGVSDPHTVALDHRERHCCIGRQAASLERLRLMRSHRCPHLRPAPRSAFAGYRYPHEVITLAVRWYLRFGLSYRDVEELLAERGIEVDHVSIYRWVHRFAPEFAEAARARQHVIGDRWHVDETYLKVGGTWRYLFRAIDQFGQVIDVYLSPRRDTSAARRFFERAIGRTRISPVEVTTDRYRVYPRVLDELLPEAFHDTEVYANNPLETDHGRLKARLRLMRGLKRDSTARVIVVGHAFVQNFRRGFYDLGTDVPPSARLADAFTELALVI